MPKSGVLHVKVLSPCTQALTTIKMRGLNERTTCEYEDPRLISRRQRKDPETPSRTVRYPSPSLRVQ
jgi:hypothetical protein